MRDGFRCLMARHCLAGSRRARRSGKLWTARFARMGRSRVLDDDDGVGRLMSCTFEFKRAGGDEQRRVSADAAGAEGSGEGLLRAEYCAGGQSVSDGEFVSANGRKSRSLKPAEHVSKAQRESTCGTAVA